MTDDVALGGRGLISVVSNEIPQEMAALVHLCLRNDFAGARGLQRRYLPLMDANFLESNPGPVKAAMSIMGLLEPAWRLPLVAPRPETIERLHGVLESLGLCERAHAAVTN